MKSCLRQDPDVILVGELRDTDTMSMALTAAETGHLVLATLHTNSCVSTLNRIIDLFPSSQQNQVRNQLTFTLLGILSQNLLKDLRNKYRMIMEVMVPNVAIRNLLRDGKIHQIYSSMQVGQVESQMSTLNQSLQKLLKNGSINLDMAMNLSYDPSGLKTLLKA